MVYPDVSQHTDSVHTPLDVPGDYSGMSYAVGEIDRSHSPFIRMSPAKRLRWCVTDRYGYLWQTRLNWLCWFLFRHEALLLNLGMTIFLMFNH